MFGLWWDGMNRHVRMNPPLNQCNPFLKQNVQAYLTGPMWDLHGSVCYPKLRTLPPVFYMEISRADIFCYKKAPPCLAKREIFGEATTLKKK
uniref:Uncharacterized protein n=1 Tax=Pyxicephalus adspersus TaxID=30357 RepID=A0AAV2ZZF4_PYXAD|nr:TPA: hypothetical protein GDO54_004552 [Pyxicephalus adspersus]